MTWLYYGWVLVLALAITETVSFGIIFYAFTVFIVPMQTELGWSRAEISGAFSLALFISGVTGVFVGRWLDRHGSRLLMTVGSVSASLLLLAWSTVDNLTIFYLIWAGLGLTMAAVLYEPAFAVVAVWFRQKRTRALTILTFIAGFASVIFLPLSEWLVRTLGWRTALIMLAIILAVITIPLHALVLRRRPEDLNLHPDGATLAISEKAVAPIIEEDSVTTRRALRSGSFWWLTISFALNTLVAVSITVHLVPYLQDTKYDSGFAAASVGFIGVMSLPGRLGFNLLAEKIKRSWLTSFIFFSQAVALLILLLMQNVAGVWLFVIVFGVGFGAITPMRAGLVAEFYGRKHYGTISGLIALFVTVARGIAPLGTGAIHDITGSYLPSFWALVLISAIAALIIPLAERRTQV